MCGIFGIVSSARRPDAGAARAALDLLAHRGPDGEGLWASPGSAPFVVLGHRRLAIIDLSDAAAQPMPDASGRFRLTFNGEIYNYLEIRAELEARGATFRTRSDTEVLLRAYETWGAECLGRLNGMFAFAIWDADRNELFAARDRFGEKPFHYAWDPDAGTFVFASEIKALLAYEPRARDLDDRALYRYLAYNELAGVEQTLWQGVRRLPHAHYLRLVAARGQQALEIRRYWDIDLEAESDLSVDAAAEAFAETFADSIRLRLRSDVPVGTSLSGGLDSSAVVCQIHALGLASSQQTFSARMDDPGLDEGRYIEAVLARTGVTGHAVWPSAEGLRGEFARLCYHLEEPFPATSQFAQYLVMRLAREHSVTVLLDGQGADEILGGYRPYFRLRYSDLLASGRWIRLLAERRGWLASRTEPFPLTAREAASKLAAVALGRTRRDGSAPAAAAARLADWFDPAWAADVQTTPTVPPRAGSRDRLTRQLYADALGGELQELLRYGDRNSMAWSREVRQPFLDHRLAEMLFALPPEHKISNGESKVVLRRAARGLLPEVILERRDKLGYEAPMGAWFSAPLLAWVEERLEAAAAELRGRVRADAVDVFRRARGTLTVHSAKAVMSLLTLAETTAQLRAAPAAAGVA